MKNSRGFTLIEILVVLAIVTLLSSIIFSKIQNSRDKAYIANGLSFQSSIDNSHSHDLLGYWNMNEVSGSTAKDSSGQNKDGTLSGTYAWITGISSNAINLDTDAQINIANNPSFLTPEFTISFWIKPEGFNAPSGKWSNTIIRARSYATDGFRLGYDGSGKVTFWSSEHGGTIDMTSSVPLKVSKWNHLVVTYSNNVASMYINGYKTATGSGTCLPFSDLSFNVSIGFGRGNKNSYDDIKFFSSSIIAK